MTCLSDKMAVCERVVAKTMPLADREMTTGGKLATIAVTLPASGCMRRVTATLTAEVNATTKPTWTGTQTTVVIMRMTGFNEEMIEGELMIGGGCVEQMGGRHMMTYHGVKTGLVETPVVTECTTEVGPVMCVTAMMVMQMQLHKSGGTKRDQHHCLHLHHLMRTVAWPPPVCLEMSKLHNCHNQHIRLNVTSARQVTRWQRMMIAVNKAMQQQLQRVIACLTEVGTSQLSNP